MPTNHVPRFSRHALLTDFFYTSLEVRCSGCAHTGHLGADNIIGRFGDQTFHQLAMRLRCQQCGSPPAAVHVCCGTRRLGQPDEPNWSVILLGRPGDS